MTRTGPPGGRAGARDIRATLGQLGVHPSRRLGQNFLVDPNLAATIVREARLQEDDVLLEVGAGLGSLTSELVATSLPVVSVEIDARLARETVRRLGSPPNLVMLELDALAGKHRLQPAVREAISRATERHRRPHVLVANLPYSISVPLLVLLLRESPPPRRLVAMVQGEVGARLAAEPGTSAYGAAGVTVQAAATVEVLRRVPPAVFFPRPRVDSVLLALGPIGRCTPARLDLVSEVASVAFARRRKTLRATLAALAAPIPGATVEGMAGELELDLSQRPERVPVEAFLALADWVGRHRAAAEGSPPARSAGTGMC